MCGRYTLTVLEGFDDFFEIDDHPEILPRYNIAPSQPVPVVRPSGSGRSMELMRWGLVPSWSDSTQIGNRMINARSETVTQKPAFKEAFQQRRCLIPADGFYEWKKGPRKSPIYFQVDQGGLFAFAGLWERWEEAGGESLLSCTILTTEPNRLTAEVHDRMPVILPREAFALWLSPQRDHGRLQRLLQAFPAERMTAREVSRYVNSPFHEGPDCLRPAQTVRQRSLFE